MAPIVFVRRRAFRRARRTVLPDDNRRHALPNDRLGTRILPEGTVAVGMDVDEARRDRHAARVNLDRAFVPEILADRDDASGIDRDVRFDARAAEAIEYGTAANDQRVASSPGQHQPRRPRQRGQRCAGAHNKGASRD